MGKKGESEGMKGDLETTLTRDDGELGKRALVGEVIGHHAVVLVVAEDENVRGGIDEGEGGLQDERGKRNLSHAQES